MRSQQKINLDKVKASLATLCPHCHYSISPAEIIRFSSEQINCPKCEAVFTVGK
jgi:transposase